MPGPGRTSTEELRRRNSWRAKIRPDEPESANGTPSCPSHLDAEGKRTWKRIIGALDGMGVLSKDHRETIVGLCDQYSLYIHAAARVNKMKKDRDVDAGEFRKWTQVASDAFKNYVRACVEFGLTPSAKARLTVTKKPDKNNKERFFKAKIA